MASFVMRSACNGRRPQSLVKARYRNRPDLVSRLLRDRHVPRFLVAPAGYGKTTVALEYAETVFGLEHVFWIACTSPCFLRDLDAGTLVSAITGLDSQAALVVFDDVPLLDAARCAALSDAFDQLLAGGCEVMVGLTPLCDQFGGLQRDRVRIGAGDLMFAGGELAALRGDDRAWDEALPGIVPPAACVACLLFGDSTAPARFLSGAMAEEMPAAMQLAQCTLLMLGEGTRAQVDAVFPFGDDVWGQLAAGYPHLGIDLGAQAFRTPCFDVADVASAVKGKIETVALIAGMESRDRLVWAWADALADRGNMGRALSCALHAMRVPERIRWADAHGPDALRAGCFLECAQVASSIGKASADERARMAVLLALALVQLGEPERAVRAARRPAFDESFSWGQRCAALLVIARHGGADESVAALGRLQGAVRAHPARSAGAWAPWVYAARGFVALQEGPEAFAECWEGFAGAGVPEDALMAMAGWVLELLADGSAASWADFGRPALASLEQSVRASLEGFDADAGSFHAAAAGIALERAHSSGADLPGGLLPTAVMLELRRAEMRLAAQRRMWRNVQAADESRRADRAAAFPDRHAQRTATSPVRPVANVPVLDVRLFGRVRVEIAGAAVDLDSVRRSGVTTLLVLLVANLGREMAVDEVAHAFWPESGRAAARRNLSALLSHLRRTLQTEDGGCPYLVRRPHSFAVEERYVRSDLTRFDDICRELLFGEPDLHAWPALYREIESDFSEDLAPAERGNDLIDSLRVRCRERLVDALVSGSGRLASAGDPRMGLWFARAAVERDRTREDAYLALMEAQVALGQRTAAMSTFLQCRRVLAEALGIDPLPEAQALYESLLDASPASDGRGRGGLKIACSLPAELPAGGRAANGVW